MSSLSDGGQESDVGENPKPSGCLEMMVLLLLIIILREQRFFLPGFQVQHRETLNPEDRGCCASSSVTGPSTAIETLDAV